jgi:hypothetical protein
MFPYAPEKKGGPPFHVDFMAYEKVVEPHGFKCAERQDTVPVCERHMPGAVSQLGAPGTGLSLWTLGAKYILFKRVVMI